MRGAYTWSNTSVEGKVDLSMGELIRLYTVCLYYRMNRQGSPLAQPIQIYRYLSPNL